MKAKNQKERRWVVTATRLGTKQKNGVGSDSYARTEGWGIGGKKSCPEGSTKRGNP